jgi:tetratricopeptide (TPR) repeat protein
MILTQAGTPRFSLWLQGFYKKHSTSSSRNQNIASFLLQMKNYPEAERYFLQTLKLSCGSAVSVYYALADIYMEMGEMNLAGLCYKRILEADPTNTTVQQALVIASKKPVKNLKGFANCLADAEATKHFNNGNIKYKEGDIKGALEEYSIAIRLNPAHSKAYLNRAYIEAVELQEFEIAVSDFDTAITLDPDFADAYLGRGSSRYNLQDIDGAMEDWKKAESLGNGQAEKLIHQHQR